MISKNFIISLKNKVFEDKALEDKALEDKYPGKIYRITYQGCEKPYYGSTKDLIN